MPTETARQDPRLEPGSFRDPESRVFYAGDDVLRSLSADGLREFEALASTELYERFMADGRLVKTELAEGTTDLPAGFVKQSAGVLRHERIPFVSYPYEWPFSMLQDAALLQLDLLLAALEEDMILKDSSPYNVQFKGSQPVFVDLGSFEKLREGEPWVGYRQFCMLYLYPLLLQAVKDVEYHPFLRGAIDGITPAQMRGLVSGRDRTRKGFYLNVFLHSKLEERHGDRGGEVKSEVKKAGFKKELIVANVKRMRKTVQRLDWSPPQGVWVAYGERNSYTDDDAKRKDDFVREVVTSQEWNLTWDIGANNGRYSRIAAEGSRTVLAVDADQGPIELLYRSLRDEGDEQILTLTMNLADPSPGLGWRGRERQALPERGSPDLVLALALIHHVTIAANVPVAEFVDWLASLDTSLVIEFPTREDPMVKKLLAPKREGLHPDYERENFERVLSGAFDVERRERSESGTRLLYFARPKGSGNPLDLTAPTEGVTGGEAASEPGHEGRRSGRLPAPMEALIAFGHLAVLSTFALAQPLFDLLSDNPEFFAARGSTPGEIITFALLLVLVPPLVLLVLELLIGLAGYPARRFAHLVLMGLLAAVVFVQALKKALEAPDAVLVALAVALGALAVLAYARAAPVRSFMSVLTLAPVVFLALFLLVSPVSRITLAGQAEAKSTGGASRVPVVMVVFDELPTGSLMDARRRVDAERYPGFAALAEDATWFRGAHTIYDSTSRAVPAIMDGTYPEREELPTSAEHPNSLFALLGKSHRMNVSEEATSVCPADLCEDARLDEPLVSRLGSLTSDLGLVYAHVVSPPGIEEDLPTVSDTWGGFGGDGSEPSQAAGSGDSEPNGRANLNGNRRKRFEGWVGAIEPGERPALNFKHTLLPHVPWQYLPDGRFYRRQADDPIPNLSRQSYPDAAQFDQLQLRHLLQLGFADLELRELIARLKKTGTYDETLVVVTADHGVALQDGRFDRRRADRSSLAEISPVPLFVKKPDQTEGKIDDSVVETTDVVPTILDVLGLDKPKGMDGLSAFSEEVKARDEVMVFARSLKKRIRVPVGEFEAERRGVLREKIRLFGEGADGPGRIYRVGPNVELLGRRVGALDSGEASGGRAALVDPDALREVDTSGSVVPSWIVGRVSGAGGPKRDIAIAVNGTVRGVGNTFELATGGGEIFAVMVPPTSLRDGENEVEIFEVEPGGAKLRSMSGG